MNPTRYRPDFIKLSKEERESVNQTLAACLLTHGKVVATRNSLNSSNNNSATVPNEEKKINASSTLVSAVVPKLEHLPKTSTELSTQFPGLYVIPNGRNKWDYDYDPCN